MASPLPPALIQLFERLQACGGEGLEVDASEGAAWPAGMADSLTEQGWITRAQPARSAICPGCEHACAMPVHVWPREGQGAAAFIVCDKRDDINRVSLPLKTLECWRMTTASLANALARQLGQSGRLAPGESMRVGWVDARKSRAPVHLTTGSRSLRLLVAGHSMELPEVLDFREGRLVLNLRALARRADAPVPGAEGPAEGPQHRAKRLRERKAELLAGGTKNFLQVMAQAEGVSVSRVKQILRTKPATSGPFDGIMRGGTAPRTVSPRTKNKR